MFKSALCLVLAVVCNIGLAQDAFPLKELVFQGASAYRPGSSLEYFLFNRGFPPGVRADEQAALIAEWQTQHPGAEIVPVSILGEKSRMPIVYVWAADGEDNLNLVLVSNGVYPGIAMLDGTQFSQVLELFKGALFADVLTAQERIGNPTRVASRRLVSDARYEDFVKRLIAAETAARAEQKGIWADKFKRKRIRMGIAPLSEIQL